MSTTAATGTISTTTRGPVAVKKNHRGAARKTATGVYVSSFRPMTGEILRVVPYCSYCNTIFCHTSLLGSVHGTACYAQQTTSKPCPGERSVIVATYGCVRAQAHYRCRALQALISHLITVSPNQSHRPFSTVLKGCRPSQLRPSVGDIVPSPLAAGKGDKIPAVLKTRRRTVDHCLGVSRRAKRATSTENQQPEKILKAFWRNATLKPLPQL